MTDQQAVTVAQDRQAAACRVRMHIEGKMPLGRIYGNPQTQWHEDLFLLSASPEPVPATNQAGEVERARELAIKYALPGTYDGISSYATRQGDADDAPYMHALLAALATQPATSQDVEAAVQFIVAASGGKCWEDPGAVEALRIAFKAGRESVSLSREGGQ